MSSPLAIAAVTAALKDVLFNGLKACNVADIVGASDIPVSTVPPDRVDITGGEDPTQLNLFLYQATSNQGWQNVGLPTRNANGDRISDNPLALNLHYLLTAYGAKDFYREIILGYAMQFFHESPVLTRDTIRNALSIAVPPGHLPKGLTSSELADQVEQIRITPEIMNIEDISKLWAAIQGHYRTTAAYQVTVVLIEGRRPRKSALPVLARRLHATPFDQAVIDSVIDQSGENAPITSSSTLLIRGRQLRGEHTQLLIGGIDLTSAISDLRDTQITLPLSTSFPAGMRAGIQTAQVVHTIDLGNPPGTLRSVESNVEAFVLRPSITSPNHNPTDVTVETVDDVSVKSGKIKIEFNPKVGESQRVVLLLNALDSPGRGEARTYSFRVPPGTGVDDSHIATTFIDIDFTRVVPGDYLVRVQVDGAESVLGVDREDNITPIVTI